MAYEFYPILSQNFSRLLDEADDYDCNVIIKVGSNLNTKEFRVHSNILKVQSPYFKRALSQNWITKKNDMINFTKPNISPVVFELIIRYMYTGILDLRKQAGSDILDLIVASDELLIEELVTFVQKYLIKNQTKWLQNNFVKVLHTVFQLESCKQLQDYCLESICEDPEPFFNSQNFTTLEDSILLGLLKRDDLQIDEIELWNYLIKWGIAQTSELSGKNTTKLNERDLLALRNTLNPFILRIRFFEISSKDFHSKVWPFKKVLPESLCEDLVSFYMAEIQPTQNRLPPRQGKITIDSIIIKPKHAAILANWTQRKDANARIPKDKYQFNLIYRGSRDGFDINTIRSKCNGQKACILVIKIKDSGTIIGGYNPLGWNYNNNGNYRGNSMYDYWANTADSFIFSLGDGKDFKKAKISRVTNSGFAMYELRYSNHTLNFGNSDLVINNNNGTCNQCYYESTILDTNNFSIEEMEIFAFRQV